MDTIVDELLSITGPINVMFDDGTTVMMPIRKLIFHCIFWTVGRKWGVVLTPDYIVDTSSINSDTISRLGTKILDAARRIHTTYHDIVFDFNEAMNTLNKFTINNCQEYHKSLSIIDLARIATHPDVKRVTDHKIDGINMTVKDAEKKISKNADKLFTELEKPFVGNTIRDFINLRFVGATPLMHIFGQIGFRTDVNDTTIRYPVQGNYLDGLRNVTEYCLESLSAKKSAFYNKDSIPNTEYFGRKQHILLSGIKYMYPGDCGTTVTMPMLITKKLSKVVLYKNIVEGAHLISLDVNNIDSYIGKVVQFRTPMACRHRNGICEACGGKLLSSIAPNTHIGSFSAIQTTSPITQVILSSKHMQRTSTVEYVIPEELQTVLMKHSGNIHVVPKIRDKFKDATLVFSVDDAVHLLCLSDFSLNRISSINEASFGNCRGIVVLKGGSPISEHVELELNGQAPMYSKYLIKYIADHPQHVVIRDDMFMVSMKGFDAEKPVFKLVVMNNSMVKFVEAAKGLLESKIKNYKSATELVNDFTNLVYEQVKPNMAYLEVVLRAALISGPYDYRLPIVTDIDDVKFTTNKNANMSRSLGMLCAFEQLQTALNIPSMFLMPKSYTPFDDFLNLKPIKR